MKYYRTGPQNVGGYGSETRFGTADGKRFLEFLHISAEREPDDIVNVSFYYAVSERLKDAITRENLSGCDFRKAKISAGPNFEEGREFLEGFVYYHLDVKGSSFRDDFSLSSHYLVLSQSALSVVSQFDVSELQNYDEGSSLDLLPEL